MKNMDPIGIVLLESILTRMFPIIANIIYSFMKVKWQYYFIRWDD